MNTTRKERFIQKATRLTVKVLLFSLLLSLFLYACIGAGADAPTGVAEATAGDYYSTTGGDIVLKKEALSAGYFTLDETWGTSSYSSYWNYSYSNGNYISYSPGICDGNGAGIKAISDNVKNGYNTNSAYAYINLVAPANVTIESVTVKVDIYARSDGSNWLSSADHSTKANFDIVGISKTTSVAQTTAEEYGDRDGTNSSSITTGVTHTETFSNGQSIQLRLTGTYYKEAGSVQKNEVQHWAQAKNISISVTGYYNVTVNTQGSGTIAASDASGASYSGTTAKFTKTSDSIKFTATPTDSKYVFTGWSDGNIDNPRTFTGAGVTPGGTYTAIFEERAIVAYDANGGVGTEAWTTETKYTTITLRTDCPYTRDGYYFVGWGTSASSTTPVTSVTTGAGGETTRVYAIWKGINYTITYDANGGTGSVGQTTGTFNGGDAPLAANSFVRTDRFFMGWDVDANATSTPNWLIGTHPNYSVAKATMGSYLTALQNGNIKTSSVSFTMYAIWTPALEFGSYSGRTGKWGTEGNPYVIRNTTHLNNLRNIVNGNANATGSTTGSSLARYTNPQATSHNYSGAFFELAASLDIGGGTVNPIGTSTNNFRGTFDGLNNTISNYSIPAGQYGGLFGYINGATLKNFTVRPGTINGDATDKGAVVGYMTGSTLSGITTSGGAVWGHGYTGGIVGRAEGTSSIINCTNLGTIVYNNGSTAGTGGILGYANGTITVTGCKNYGTTSPTSANNNTTYNVYFSNDTARDGWGGIVGYSNSMLTLSGCENRASLIWKQNNAGHDNFYAIGGIVGKMNNGLISSSKNFGNIEGGKLTGGIVGEVIGGATVSQCYNAGAVQTWSFGKYTYYNGDGAYVGGIAGASRGTIEYCYSIGSVTDNSGKGFAGGIAAATEGNINYCYSVATISSSVGTGVGNLLGHSPSVVNVGTSWAFFSGAVPSTSNTCELNGSTWTRGRAAVLPSSIATASIPSVVVPALGNVAYSSWEQITEYKFDGFGLTFTTNANSFVQAVNLTTSKVAGTTPIEASFVSSSTSINGTTSTSVSNQVTLSMGFSANIDNSHAGLYIDPGKAIGASINSKTYDATSEAPVLGTGNAGSQARFLYYHGGKWQTTAPTNAGTYSVAVEVISNGGVIGRQTGLSYTINKRTLTVTLEMSGGWAAYTYNAAHQGVTFVKVENLPTALTNAQKENVFQVTSDGTNSVTLSKVHGSGTLQYNVSDAVNVGSYSVNITLSDTSNYTLTGRAAGSYSWTISKRELTLTATFENNQNLFSYEYSAGHQGVNQLQISNFPTNSGNQNIVTVETLSGSTKPTVSQKTQNPLVYSISGAKDVGNYGFVVTLIDTHNYTLKYGSTTSATHNFSWAITPKNLADSDINPNFSQPDLEYTGEEKDAGYTVKWAAGSGAGNGANDSGAEITLLKNNDFTASYNGVDRVNVTGQAIVITITGKGNYTGTRTFSYTIVPYDLVAHILTTRDAFIYYGGTAFGAPSRNETYGWDMYPFVNLTDSNGYAALDAGITSDAQIYDIVYSAERFKLVTNLGQLNPNLITAETTLTDGEVFDSINAATGVSSLTTITWRGTQNYTGTITVKFVVVNSDFGAVSPADRNGDGKVESEWGSVDNPYVISHWIHLLRLSEIVNGNSDPINSVRGMGVNENNASANVVASDIFYSAHNADGTIKRSYFLMNSDIDIPEYVSFNPIGGVTFSSAKKDAFNNDVTLSYFGGVFNGYEAGANRTYTINLRDHLNDDYTLLSENFRAGGEDVDNLFDGNTATKLCYDNGSGSATFIIEISNPRYLRGFYWATANDTFHTSYTSRNPYNFQIWGSNDNSTWTQLINISKDNWVGENFTYSENVNFTNPGAYRYVKVTVRNKSNSGLLQLSEFGVYSDYVGLFGVVKGNVINNTAAHAEVNNVVITTTSAIEGNDYVGSLIGKADSYVRVDYTYKSGNALITSQYNNTIAINGANYVGGVVGYLGLGSEMYGEFVNNANVSGSSYVGGIIGQIMAGAGRQGTGANAGTYYLGEYTIDGVKRVSSMTNYGSVVGSQAYTGGVIGAMTQNNVAPYDGVITVFEPTFIRNEANVTGQTVVGGLVGRIELNNAIRLINTEDEGQANWSYNGNIDSTVYEITTNTSYAGGLFGVLSTMGHQIESVFSTAVVKTSVDYSLINEGNYIGGLVGYMNGGTFRYSFVSLPGNQNVDTTTDMVRGDKYVGGLVGNMALGTLDTCYVQGFMYDNNLTTARGGVAGVAATVATIKDTWALYLTADPTYQSVPANAYGNYILSFCSSSDGAMNAYIDEMFVFAGLISDGAVSRAHATGSAGEIEAKKGSISLGIALPSVGTITGYDQKAQVVFYDGSGYEDPFEHAFEAAANDSNEQNLFLRLSASTEGSVIIAKTSVRFGSISNYTNSTAWEEKYLYIGKTGLYKVDVVDHPDDDGNYHRGSYQTSYSFDYSATGNYVKTSRDLTFQYAKYSAVAPRVIASVADWNAFATDVKNSGVGGLRQYVKLANNITVTQSNLAGRESTDDISAHNFQGTFDGDGYTITININGANAASRNELGLFPQAGNATFKNLTIKGTWTNLGNDCGAFVGHARGWLTFENCISDVDMSGNGHSHGGILGSTSAQTKYDYTFIACVNLGDITSYESGSQAYGVGGIIGNVWNGYRDSGNDSYSSTFGSQPIIRLDSCRNAGNIMASYNVGGIIGRTGGATEIISCGNTGNIEALCEGTPSAPLATNSISKDGSAGGIIGLVGGSGYADVYASYNTGTVHAWGNKAGGIMGSDTEYTTQSHVTKVYYCYNTGTVSTGGKKFAVFNWAGVEIFGVMIGDPSLSDNGTYTIVALGSGQWWGVNCGGILGTAVNSDIRYCYNAGDIVVRGASGEVGTWHGRVGGIVGMVDGTTTYIRNSYNVGDIKVESRGASNDRPKYAGGIVGYFKVVEGTEANIFDCYSLKWQIQWQNDSGNYKRYHIGGYNHSGISIGGDQYDTDTYASSGGAGHVLSSVAELTAMMKSNEEISTNSVNSLNGSSESDAGVLINNDIKSGNYPGWIFLPGCLPQLSMFAVDTQNGLAMTSLGYGRNNLGEFVQQVAGSEFNPYVIKDGIDLLGVMALTSAKGGNSTFGFDGKFIEFANGTNNLAGDVCTYIQLPTSDVNSGNDYVFYDGSTKKKGKSYHLYDRGANGLHNGTLSTSDATISASNKTAPATSVYATNQESSGNFTLNSSNAYATWKARNYGYNGSWTSNVGYGTTNWNPIGYLGDSSVTSGGKTYYRDFRGHITGDLGDGTNAEIRDINSYYGFNRTNVYAGLFGVVRNAHVENITVTGTIHADTLNDNGIISAGIVAKALDNSYISGLQAGTAGTAGTEPRSLTVKTGPNGGAGYTGGIVGMADSGATGNRLTIADSVVINASIKGFKDSIGGIIGYSVGADASSFTDIIGCHVVGAHIESTASEKKLLGGIVGAQGATGALTVSGCHVGTEGNTPADLDSESSYGVVIKGDHSFGGIISFAEAGAGCANAFIDCYVWEDVLIKRYNDNNETDKGYGTAIGGIVGYVSDDAAGYATFRGEIEFHGTINVSGFDNVQNVGGVVGYMGSSARMEQCFVTVAGTIDAESCSNADSIGGFAGISKGVALDGIFTIAPSLLTDTADNVGGFIGLNDGDTYITRTTTIETGGQIKAHYNVGGFIGANAEGSALHMGAAEYKGTVYGEDGDKASITLGASVDGQRYIGGFLGYNNGKVFGEHCLVTNTGAVGTNDSSKGTSLDDTVDCIGGVFGDNSSNGDINISADATFINNGQVGHEDHAVAYQEFVGGVLGVALGDITNEGTLGNTGSVYGYQYVGGAIGGLVRGVISGELSNGNDVVLHATAESEALVASDEAVSTAATGSSSVKAVVNVGGVIGVIMQGATISGATLTNYGSVTSTGDSYNVSNLGGAIGLNYGIIENSEFYNYGKIKAKNFAGGAIGVNDGTIRNSDFVNSATITFTGDTALGGAVGYITNNYTTHGTTAYYPDNPALSAYEYNDSTRNFSTVTDSYFGYESIDNSKVVVQATGVDPYAFNANDDADSAFAAQGGLGGVFGAINSDDMKASGGWSGNTFFVYGDVYGGVFKSNDDDGGVYVDDATTPFTNQNFGGTVQAVGGVIGAIEVSYISIHNMLIYKSNVGGLRRVGGVVGFNGNANSTEGAGAAVDNCYNVYGNVIGTSTSVRKVTDSQIEVGTITVNYEDVGGIVGYIPTDPNVVTGEAYDPKTNASYWIKSYANELLQNSNPDNITETLDKASTWTEFLSYADYSNNVDELDANGNPIHLVGEIDTWDKYFAANPGLYVQNANGDWGSYSEESVTIKYNTGTLETGYYYLFADDSASFTDHPEGVVVDHENSTDPLDKPYSSNESLNYWLIIVGSAKRAQQPDGTYYNEYASDSVHENVGGAVKAGYIYSTAYASTKNGFYLYVKDQGNATTLNGEGDKIYISSDANTAGNIMIFYKEVVPYNNFVYNGYERYAQLVDINFSEDQPTEGVGEENINNYFGKYYYTFNGTVPGEDGIGINRATNAGSHDLKATIWTVDSKGKPITLGSVDSTIDGADQYKWSIKKRNIEVDFDTQSPHIVDTKNNEDPADAFRFDNTFSHYIKFTVSNIAIDVDEDVSSGEKIMEIINKIVTPKYSFNGGSESSLVDLKEGSVVPEIQVPQNSEVANVSFYAVGANSTSGSKNDTDNCYVYATDEYKNIGSVKLYSATYIVYFKKAGSHKVSVTATDTNHRASSSDNKTVSVDKRELKLEVNTSENNWKTVYTFDGGKNWQGVTSVVISNFIAGTLDDKTDYITTTGSTEGLSNGKNNGNADEHIVVDASANTITVNFYANDAASYNAVVELAALFKDSYYFVFKGTEIGTLSSGTEPSKWNVGWTINPYTIVAQADGISGGTYVYDGTIHAVKIASGDDSITGGVEGAPETVEVSIDVNMTDSVGNSISQACNVGTYTATIEAASGVAGVGKVIAESSSKSSASINNYVIEFSLKEGSNLTATITITPCPIEVNWKNVFNNKAGNGYVYDGNTNGPVIGSLTVGEVEKAFSNGKAEGVTKDESISLSVGYTVEKNASTSVTAYTKDFKVTGTNAVGDALASNYTFVGGAGYDEGEDRVEKTFSRAKSIVYVDVTVENIPDKVFDNTTNVGTITYDHTVRSTNSSKTCSVTGRSLTGKFSDANVGSNKTVNLTFSASLSDTTNFEWASTKYNITGVKTADITARPLYIQLNNGANGSIYKTYDNSTLYASVTSDSGDEKQSTGIQWRTGRGILVSNFCTSDITVTASFLEVDQKNRSDFNAYVNDIYKDTNGEYVIGGTSATDTSYKMLRFVLSGEGSTNYYIAQITDKSGNVLKSNANTGLTTLDIVDTAEDNVSIVIKKASVKVNYSNTSQSYANADNTYNTNWNEVTGQISTSKYKNLADVHVENGWMYDENGDAAVYKKYTRIAGSATSPRLGATLTSADGKHLCLTLRNQPTLIIGYFVEKKGGYEIGSMAGLLIASEYFKNNFNTSDEKGYDYIQTEIPFSKDDIISGHSSLHLKVPENVYTQIANNEITTWEQLLAAVPEYDPRGYTHENVEYEGANYYLSLLDDLDDVTDEYLKAALQSQLDSFEFVYELINASGEAVESETLHLVWWVPVEVKDTRSYNSFILVDNIDAILTDADIDMLTGAFGSNYGVGKTYLPNVVFAEAGSVVIFNGPIFDYSTDKDDNKVGFNGIFDGDGYSIDHLTIAYVVTETSHNNVGMFAEVSGEGSQVTKVNLRNLNIQVIDTTASAKVINVGGVAGKFAASTVMEDVTVHGTISVKSTLGTVYAGGVIGSDSTGYVDGGVSKVIDGAIVVATVRAEGAIAVAGGVIGIMNEVNTTLTDVVSLSEVYAEGANTYANGFVGQYAKLVDGNASYDQDGIDYAPLNSTGKTSAYMNSVFEISADGTYTRIAGGVPYDTLYVGSTSIFIESGAPGGYVVYPTSDQKDSKPESNTYDVINEYLAGSETNARESMRLRDIVDTYVLGYELTKTTVGEIATYAKATTSKYVGEANGVAYSTDPDTKAKPINIAYQQHLNLIRMFNYMNFTLNKDVTMYTGYKLYMVDEAFTGTIESNGHEVNVRSSESNKDFVDDDDDDTTYPQFFAYQDVNFTWLKKD
ncbi:MAG: InlB B-repeat-containing protein [Clostridia bacterium]|nr:InlB B-repeat-containing protein [Clostridia bacterium]